MDIFLWALKERDKIECAKETKKVKKCKKWVLLAFKCCNSRESVGCSFQCELCNKKKTLGQRKEKKIKAKTSRHCVWESEISEVGAAIDWEKTRKIRKSQRQAMLRRERGIVFRVKLEDVLHFTLDFCALCVSGIYKSFRIEVVYCELERSDKAKLVCLSVTLNVN